MMAHPFIKRMHYVIYNTDEKISSPSCITLTGHRPTKSDPFGNARDGGGVEWENF
jgi:hypothetical protein